MRRKFASFTICMVLVFTMFVLVDMGFEVVVNVDGDTNWIYVDDDNVGYEDGSQEHPYNTIQEALQEGDNIYVFSGSYDGPVNVGSYITMVSEGATVIGGENPDFIPGGISYPSFDIMGHNIKISGFTPYSGYFCVNIQSSSNVTISDFTFHGCFYPMIHSTLSSDIHVQDSTIMSEGCFNDAWIHDTDDFIIEDCIFGDWNSQYGWFTETEGGDFWVHSDSHLLLINSGLETASVQDTSTVIIGWYLTVLVEDLDGNPVEGATVQVKDSHGAIVFTKQTDVNGRVEDIVVFESVRNSTSTVLHTPHNITATFHSFEGFAKPEHYMNENKEITITLYEKTGAVYLSQGFNLISLPTLQNDTDIQTALQSIQGDYDAAQYYDGSDSRDPWKHYHVSKPAHMNDLKKINNTMGIWIHTTEPGIFYILPEEDNLTAPQSIHLHFGWNMVGYPSSTIRLRDDALNNLVLDGQISIVEFYNITSGRIEKLDEDDYMKPGMGFWIFANTPCVWEVPL